MKKQNPPGKVFQLIRPTLVHDKCKKD